MKKLLEFLLPICFHEGEIESKTNMYQSNLFDFGEKTHIGVKYTLRCKKCGEMKIYEAY